MGGGPLKNHTKISLPSSLGEGEIITSYDRKNHLDYKTMFPVVITFPEKLMSSWSFRGAFFDYHYSKQEDLAPSAEDKKIKKDTTHWRQNSSLRTILYDKFFTASDKSFADANSKWALSADVTSTRYFLGYYFGVFFPAFEYHRFLKFGAGLGVYYVDLYMQLNLCTQYKITPKKHEGKDDVSDKGHGGACVGKTEIASSSYKGFGSTFVWYLSF